MRKLLAVAVVLSFGLVAAGQDYKAEQEFKKSGPTLYSMDEALALSKTTGKPVVCWMGAHLFANAEARQLSKSLGETTIQAAMDSDGTEYDRVGFRVKFSSNQYKDGTTFYVPMARFGEPGMAEKILAKVRSGK